MKFQLDGGQATYQIQHYDLHSVIINDQKYMQSIIVMPEYLSEWAVTHFDALKQVHFQRLRALNPELVLLGTGSRIRFPTNELLTPLIEEGIGIEVMDTPAACRTYLILMAEGRKVAAALLFK